MTNNDVSLVVMALTDTHSGVRPAILRFLVANSELASFENRKNRRPDPDHLSRQTTTPGGIFQPNAGFI